LQGKGVSLTETLAYCGVGRRGRRRKKKDVWKEGKRRRESVAGADFRFAARRRKGR